MYRYSFALGDISDDTVSRDRIAAGSSADEQIVGTLDHNAGFRAFGAPVDRTLLDFYPFLFFFFLLIVGLVVLDELLAELGDCVAAS